LLVQAGDPYAAPPSAPPPPRRPSVLAIFVAGALVGGIAGGGAAALVAGTSRLPEPATPVATLPSAPAATGVASAGVVDVVEELSPSVVTVVNRLASGQAQSSGSGFLVDAQRGYVITNSHVVSNVRGSGVGASFDVIFSDDRKVKARLVGRDNETDVAVLEVGAQSAKALVLGNSDQAPIGGTVVAIGSALGDFRNSVTVGVLSGKGRRLQSEIDPNVFLEDLIQTDAAISPGNSGGPLILAATRQVVGVNTLVIRVAGSEGLGFAVSSNTVRQIADELIKNGRIERGLIGITYTPLSSRQALSLGLPSDTTGVLVSDVVPGTAASSAGIRQGDVVVSVNEQRIDEEHPLKTIMLRFRPGDRVRLTVLRDGKQQAVEITLGRQT
jgi:2-alkenal reductase